MRFVSYIATLWYFTISLELILAALVLWRRTFQKFPFFVLYILTSTARSLILWGVYRLSGYRSFLAFDIFWITEAVQLIGHVAVCAELCWRVLRPYPGLFWCLARDVFVALGSGIAIYAAFDSIRVLFHVNRFVLALERGTELGISVVLVSLLLIALRYKIVIPKGPFLLVTGLCFYAVIQTVNISFLWRMAGNFPWWNDLRAVAFQIALLLWIFAIFSVPPDTADNPIQTAPEVYVAHAEIISQKLQDLDQELEEIIKR